MDMNPRVPDESDRRPDELSTAPCTSGSELLHRRAADHSRGLCIGAGTDFVMSHDAELLKRLEDA